MKNRREFITLLGSAAAWPFAAHAQQTIPVIGYLHSASPEPYTAMMVAFRQGLAEAGYLDGSNVAIDYRWAEGQFNWGSRAWQSWQHVLEATSESEIDAAFRSVTQERDEALIVVSNPLFTSRRDQIVTLANYHRVPAIYPLREYAVSGGLVTYGASIKDAYRQSGVYAGRLLNGAKPADLPVMQPAKFELVINLKTAKALGLEIPPTLLARADEVIE